MSTPTSKAGENSGPQVYRKPRADIFTMLLVIALLAIITATVVLWQLMAEYEYKFKGGPSVSWNAPAAALQIASHESTALPPEEA